MRHLAAWRAVCFFAVSTVRSQHALMPQALDKAVDLQRSDAGSPDTFTHLHFGPWLWPAAFCTVSWSLPAK
jgi:hypothetical protein